MVTRESGTFTHGATLKNVRTLEQKGQPVATQTAESSRLAQHEFRPLPASGMRPGYRSTQQLDHVAPASSKGGTAVIILRRVIGDELRRRRQQ